MLKELGFCRVKGFGIPDAPESEKAPAPPPVVWADVESTEKQRLFRYIESGGEDLSLTPLERTVPEMVQARREVYRTMIRRYEGTLTRHIETEVAAEIVKGLTTLIEMAIVEKICGDGCRLSPARLRDFAHLPTQVHEGGQWIDKPGRSEQVARSISKECIVDGKPVRLDDALKLTEALKMKSASVVAPYVTVDELTAMAGPIDHARLAQEFRKTGHLVIEPGPEVTYPGWWAVKTTSGLFVYHNKHNSNVLGGLWTEPHVPGEQQRLDRAAAQERCNAWNKIVYSDSDGETGLDPKRDSGRLVELDSKGQVAKEQPWQGRPIAVDEQCIGLQVEFRVTDGSHYHGRVLVGEVHDVRVYAPWGSPRIHEVAVAVRYPDFHGLFWLPRSRCILPG